MLNKQINPPQREEEEFINAGGEYTPENIIIPIFDSLSSKSSDVGGISIPPILEDNNSECKFSALCNTCDMCDGDNGCCAIGYLCCQVTEVVLRFVELFCPM